MALRQKMTRKVASGFLHKTRPKRAKGKSADAGLPVNSRQKTGGKPRKNRRGRLIWEGLFHAFCSCLFKKL
jgi:hypothetical protein